MYNALQTIQAFEAGQGQRKERERERTMQGVGNALASGNYAGGAGLMFNMGDIQGGLKVAEYGKSLQDAEAEKKRVGLIKTGMGLLQTPRENREAMRPQLAMTLQQFGVQLDEQQLAGMDLSDEGIKATLATLQDIDSVMAQYQGMMEPPEYGFQNVDGVGLVKTDPRAGTAETVMAAPPQAVNPSSPLGKIVSDYKAGFITKEQADAAIAKANTQSGGMQVSLDENGNPVVTFGGPGVGSAFGSRGDSVGASAFGTSLEDAGTADNTLALFNTAAGILEGGFNSGALADIRGRAGAIANDLGLGIPGFSKPENVADYEQFSAINKQLAAQMLKLFGGSDTERELAISITSNIGPGMSEETNRRMIETGRQIIERQRSKPEFIAQWTRRYGSLDAINPETGLGFQATWDRYLQGQISSMSGAASDTRQVGVESAAQGVLPANKMRRLEELRRKRDAGSIQ